MFTSLARIAAIAILSLLAMTTAATSTGIAADEAQYIAASELALDADQREWFVEVRESFGLPSDSSVIDGLLADRGVPVEWGFPMSAEEVEMLERRVEIQDRWGDDIVLALHEINGYAGFYFDHQNGGRATVLTTEPDPSNSALARAIPGSLRDSAVVRQVEHSRAALEGAARNITESDWLGIDVTRVAIKTQSNSLKVSIADASTVALASEAIAKLTSIDVEVVVEGEQPLEVCSSRDICYSPHRAGIRVTGNSGSSLGFGISHNSDRQYLIAGHATGSSFSHYIYSLGSSVESEYFDYGIDAQALSAPNNSQVSDDIYITASYARDVIGQKYPSVGLTACISGLKTVSCGNVVDDYLSYNPSGPVSYLIGASANYSSQTGDSGAPIYQPSGTYSAYALGIHSTGSGDKEFARASDLWSRMGASILTS